MIQRKTKFKDIYNFFELSRRVVVVYLIAMGLIVVNDLQVNKLRQRKINLLAKAKKGNVLIYGFTGGRKSNTSIYGKLMELKSTAEVTVVVSNGNSFLIKTITELDSGKLYPVWYTDDKELVIARNIETKDGMIKYLKKFNKEHTFTINPAYVVLTMILLLFIVIDFYRGKKIC